METSPPFLWSVWLMTVVLMVVIAIIVMWWWLEIKYVWLKDWMM